MFRFLFVFCCVFLFSNVSLGMSCIDFKQRPNISISTPDAIKKIVQPIEPMDLYHGNVVATFVQDFDIEADVNKVDDGFCVGIKNIDAIIGYNNFLVSIDIRNLPNSCSYNAVLNHEEQHINVYLSVVDEFYDELKKSVFVAADSVMPVFVKSEQDVEYVLEEFNNELSNHPEIILLQKKIDSMQQIKNNQIDEFDDRKELKNCPDFF
ncbi:MAG: hypothetical protein ACLRFI_02820 [Alphaproteobacteria bacterium]